MAIRAAGTAGSINRPTKYCGQYVKSSVTTVPHAMAVSKAMRSVAATRLQSGAEVITDNRLCGLGDGITYHENKGGIVACDAECAHAIIAQIAHEYLIANEHQYGHSTFSQ